MAKSKGLRSGKADLDHHIRETKGLSYKKSALEWFRKNLGKAVTSSELARIEGKKGRPISHNIRRIFELRDEDGYKIVNWNDNKKTRLNLKRNEWVLLEKDPDPSRVRPRGVNKRIRMEVFERDGFKCQICGKKGGNEDPFRPDHGIKLHTGHVKAHKKKGGEEVFCVKEGTAVVSDKKLTKDDFVTMCNVCNEGLKNKDLDPGELPEKIRKRFRD